MKCIHPLPLDSTFRLPLICEIYFYWFLIKKKKKKRIYLVNISWKNIPINLKVIINYLKKKKKCFIKEYSSSIGKKDLLINIDRFCLNYFHPLSFDLILAFIFSFGFGFRYRQPLRLPLFPLETLNPQPFPSLIRKREREREEVMSNKSLPLSHSKRERERFDSLLIFRHNALDVYGYIDIEI